MFMCETCHKDDKHCKWDFEMHFMKSHGACEICKKVGGCVDCKAYKYAAKDAAEEKTYRDRTGGPAGFKKAEEKWLGKLGL
jgi:hypothetical protein